jgi:hypothetical protein
MPDKITFDRQASKYSDTVNKLLAESQWFVSTGISFCGILKDCSDRIQETLDNLEYADEGLIRKDVVVGELTKVATILNRVADNANSSVNHEVNKYNTLMARLERIVYEMNNTIKETTPKT